MTAISRRVWTESFLPGATHSLLRAEPGALVMELTARDAPTLRELEDVVTRHLARFAWREPPSFAWR